MRPLALLGAGLFGYLTLIPLGLVGSTLDPACAGSGCSTSTLSDAVFLALFGACALTLAATATVLGAHALAAPEWTSRALPIALGAAFAASSATAYALFAISSPIAAVVIAAGGLGLYGLLRWNRDRYRSPDQHDPGANGNGRPHRHRNGRLGASRQV